MTACQSTLTINDTPDGSTITIDAENRLIDLDRPSNFRYTKESNIPSYLSAYQLL